MDKFAFDLQAYLRRIQYSGSLQPTEALLAALHRAQIYAIPFENLDIILGRSINLDPAALFDKLVHKQRGGYCFELNGLFLMALNAIGFDAQPLLGRVHFTGPPNGRGHQITLVTLEGKQWVADVGFGHPSLRVALELQVNQPTMHDGRAFRLVDAQHFGFMLQTLQGDEWQNLYSFDLGYVCPADIEFGNYFASTHPRSLFTTSCMAILPNAQGVTKLFKSTLTRIIEDKEYSEEVAAGEPYLDVLKKDFGIGLKITGGLLLG
jgi:N-hydroxyarylamine O-acetyltransferase